MKNSIKLILAPALLVLWLLPINGMATSNASTAVNLAANTQITTPTTLAQRRCLNYIKDCRMTCIYISKHSGCYHCSKSRGIRRAIVYKTCSLNQMFHYREIGFSCSSIQRRICKLKKICKWKCNEWGEPKKRVIKRR